MDHRQVINLKLLFSVMFPMLLFPMQAEEQVVDLKNALPTLQDSEMPEFLEEVWKLKDYELMGYVLKEGDRNLLKYFKIKLGSAPADEFKSKVGVLFLRAPEKFWDGDPPSSGAGTIDFSARRAILEILADNLDGERFELEDIKDSEKRKILADRLEKSLEVNLSRVFFNDIKDSQRKPGNGIRENKLNVGRQKESTNRPNQKDEIKKDVDEKTQSNLPWIIVGVLLMGILALLLNTFKRGSAS